MRKTSAALAVVLVLLAAATADAHRSRWYWTEHRADTRLMQSYSDVRDADCFGFGPTRRTSARRVMYSHFTCSLTLDDGTGLSVTVEVRGRRRARVLYNHATDIIR